MMQPLPIASCFSADFVVPAINAYASVLLCRRSAARDSVICKTCSRMANISLIKLLIPAKKHNHATSHFEILLDSFYLVGPTASGKTLEAAPSIF